MTSKKSDVLKDAEEIKTADVVEAAKTDTTIDEKVKDAVVEKLVEKVGEKVEKDKNEKAIKDLTLYVASGFDFKSLKGPKVVVPPLGGKQEKKAILSLLTFLSGDDGIMEQLFVSGGNVKIPDLIKILTSGGEGAWDCLVKITGYLLDQPEEWISERLMLPDMLQVVRPFFLTEGKTLIQAFKG